MFFIKLFYRLHIKPWPHQIPAFRMMILFKMDLKMEKNGNTWTLNNILVGILSFRFNLPLNNIWRKKSGSPKLCNFLIYTRALCSELFIYVINFVLNLLVAPRAKWHLNILPPYSNHCPEFSITFCQIQAWHEMTINFKMSPKYTFSGLQWLHVYMST